MLWGWQSISKIWQTGDKYRGEDNVENSSMFIRFASSKRKLTYFPEFNTPP
jgi:hypothetical protein